VEIARGLVLHHDEQVLHGVSLLHGFVECEAAVFSATPRTDEFHVCFLPIFPLPTSLFVEAVGFGVDGLSNVSI
jgi:hypothetical protein